MIDGGHDPITIFRKHCRHKPIKAQLICPRFTTEDPIQLKRTPNSPALDFPFPTTQMREGLSHSEMPSSFVKHTVSLGQFAYEMSNLLTQDIDKRDGAVHDEAP
jgi:hypothetical protein